MKKKIHHTLTTNGLKVTPQRIAVLEVLLSNDVHPSADIIAEKVRKKNPGIATGTVYNVLDCLVEKGIIRKIPTQSDKTRYDAFTHTHHHIHVDGSDKIIDYYDEELDTILNDYFQKKNIENIVIRDIRLQIQAQIKQ